MQTAALMFTDEYQHAHRQPRADERAEPELTSHLTDRAGSGWGPRLRKKMIIFHIVFILAQQPTRSTVHLSGYTMCRWRQ
jgi:hypothetical protein